MKTGGAMASVSALAAAASVYEAWSGNADRGLLLLIVAMVSLLIAAVDALSARPPVKVVVDKAIPVERTVTGPDGVTYALTVRGYEPVDRARVAARYDAGLDWVRAARALAKGKRRTYKKKRAKARKR